MVVSFSKLGNYGRLGNQLMEIASTMGLAEKHNMQPSFPDWSYEPYFEKPLPHGKMMPNQVKEKAFTHYEWDIPAEGCDILGYLQSEKYFPKNIREQFKFKESFLQAQKDIYPLQDKTKICLQVRRGDYVGNPNYYQLPITYYIDSLYRHFTKWQDCQIIIISDDIEYCRVHFECLPNAIFTSGTEIEDIAIASICDHFIIANSTFGWWAAYLGEKENTKVIHPGHLCIGALGVSNDTKDYWPDRWIENKQDGYKLDLKDTTFTVPVFYDHPDRKKNLDLSACMLQKYFDTNIIIGEQSSNAFAYMAKYCKYHFFSGMKYFHRTKMLNDMAEMAKTPIVANWDCDVIIPPMQIWLTVEAIRKGADMVFPYDGRFARMPRLHWFPIIEKRLDIGMVGGTELKGKHGKPMPETSVGGAVFFNKDSFIDGGMENENMISYGPEDCERNDRFKALGYDVQRVGGCLYHMDHYCGVNSGTLNPFFKANHAELEKIRQMTPEQLRQYVDGWPWVRKYSAGYYRSISEGSERSAKHVFAALPIKPESVVDVGCGIGAWKQDGIEWYGFDFGVPKRVLYKDVKYTDIDLSKAMPAVLKVDMALCVEVAEHIPETQAADLVAYLCSCSDYVLFGAAIPHQGGTGHINEQWQAYWGDLFAANGYYLAKKQPDIRNNTEIELWYRQNIILFQKGGKGKVENFVLPEYYEQIVIGAKNAAKI